MKKLLNTLFITSKNSYLRREGETILVEVDKKTKQKIPIHILQSIICFGNVMCSPSLMQLCALRNVQISFLSTRGTFIAKVKGPITGNVLLRREQYRKADDQTTCALIARSIIIGKIANSRTILLRAAREHKSEDVVEKLKSASSHLAYLIKKLDKIEDLDSLRGIEGEAAKTYFSVFDCMILSQKDDFFFKERSRRPPLDNMNALMSFIYTLLTNDFIAALESIGLDPAVGYLHKDRPGRPSLALDMIEEARSFIADRLALSLINRQQIKGAGFVKSETGDIRMSEETRKVVLSAYQAKKQEEIYHPFIEEKIAIGLVPHVQALLFSRYIRGDLDGYPPFIYK